MENGNDMDTAESVIKHIEVKGVLYGIRCLRKKLRREDMSEPGIVHEFVKDVDMRIVWKGIENGQEVIEIVPVYEFRNESWVDIISDRDSEYVRDIMEAGQVCIALYRDK